MSFSSLDVIHLLPKGEKSTRHDGTSVRKHHPWTIVVKMDPQKRFKILQKN
jgi:hypothetical protein